MSTAEERLWATDRVIELRSKLVEAALAWQLAVDAERNGTDGPISVNIAGIALYKATKAYRAATR